MNRIEIVRDSHRFAALHSEWNDLLRKSRTNTVFLTWEWLHTWWKHLADGRELFLVTVRRGASLIAIAPLAMNRAWSSMTTLEFLGIGSVGSDYLDFIVDSACESEGVGALTQFFVNTGLTLRLQSMKEDAIAAAVVARQLSDRGWRMRSVEMQVCPYIKLSGHSFESYLESLGSSHRYNFRRRLRNLEKVYDVNFERAESAEECSNALKLVIDLHLRRWSTRGGSDGFHRGRLIDFHREFCELARQRGWLRLRLLTLSGRPVGAFYGFRYIDKYCFYQSGFDDAFIRQSVGLVTLGLTIREAVEEGAAEYDMLHGDESYKFLWTENVRPLYRLELYAPGVAGGIHRHSAVAFAATKKLVKRALYAPSNR